MIDVLQFLRAMSVKLIRRAVVDDSKVFCKSIKITFVPFTVGNFGSVRDSLIAEGQWARWWLRSLAVSVKVVGKGESVEKLDVGHCSNDLARLARRLGEFDLFPSSVQMHCPNFWANSV